MALAPFNAEVVARPRDVLAQTARVMKHGMKVVAGPVQWGQGPTVDPSTLINGYLDSVGRFTAQVVTHNTRFSKDVAAVVLSARQAVIDQTSAITVDVRDYARTLSEVFRAQVDEVRDVAREQADAVEREVRREAAQARREARAAAAEPFLEMTKPELQAELAKRELPKTGTVDELRSRLVKAELEAD